MITKEDIKNYVVSRFSHLSPEPPPEQKKDLKERIRKAIQQYNVGEPSGHNLEGNPPTRTKNKVLSATRRTPDLAPMAQKYVG